MKGKKFKENEVLKMLVNGYALFGIERGVIIKMNLRNYKIMACFSDDDYKSWGELPLFHFVGFVYDSYFPVIQGDLKGLIKSIRKNGRILDGR